MKKVLVILMTLVMVFAVTACGNNEGASSSGEMTLETADEYVVKQGTEITWEFMSWLI